jgi:signal transduction histidine kinase
LNLKPKFSLRWKILYLIGLSILLSVLTAASLFVIAVLSLQVNIPVARELLSLLQDIFGIPVVLVLVSLSLFVFFLLILSQPSIRYLLEITRSIQHIADGNFDYRIQVRTQDELGGLADNINKMAATLKVSLEEERLAEQTKVELITNVSHDLRTPLTSIVGYLGLIDQDRYRDEVELRQYVQIAYQKSLRLKVLINDLFEYTRTSGGIKLHRTNMNLIEMMGQLAAQFRLQLEQEDMECRLITSEKQLNVSADGEKLVRVFENLIVNAIKYGHEGKFVDLKARHEGEMAIIEIINYGEPLPASSIPYLFERFYRIEQSRSEQSGGSGLGLAIAKNIVELHHGTISVLSDDSRTTFEVKLPIQL